ncbi:MAG: helix-turn-helix domain-containing protein [Bacteroides sp.]|nr:helix-turn-helix domain-containing protein [Bacillota bacterium]MCM1393291.1 helix-turn-helix domain-containing protein [[Eubacterium] siraeum]MCM1455739.1 helix-turn-helix domain-containing protein [Bacteroides sp.]
MTTIENVSKRIVEARKVAGYTQQQVADILKIHISQWQKYEYAKIQLDYDKIIAICKLFDISADYLFGLSNH